MKNLRKLTTAVLFLLTATFITSCDDDDDNAVTPENTAYDFLEDNPNYSSLKAAVDAAGLRSTLEGPGPFTIFAPDNAAFTAFFNNSADFDELSDVPTTTLQSLLLYHVLGTEVTSSALANGYVKTAANNGNGSSLDAYVSADEVEVNGVALNTAALDIEVDNGVIHGLQGVLSLPTVADLASFNPTFGNLTTALGQENLVETLNGTGPFTVLAPTNDAFTALIDADDQDGIEDINDVLELDDLDQILLFHVISGTAVRSDALADGDINPANNGDSTFTIVTSTTPPSITIDGETAAEIVVTDVTAPNGVVHAISGVLLPGDQEED